jgi:outer membrane biosynthesis protein TonB
MATAIAPNLDAADAYPEFHIDPHGVQGLLQPKPQKPHYYAQAGAAAVYALLLGAVVTLTFKAAEQPVEEQQVIELAPIPADEPPPEDTLPPPEELALPDPPPPPLIDPVAPVEEVKPAPKPIEKPKIEKKVEKPPVAKPRTDARPSPTARTTPGAARTDARTDAPAMRAPAAPPGATPSAIANQFHACLQRAAASFEAPLAGRVSYSASFSATGSLTSFSPSGSGPLVAIASRLGGRCGSVAAPGRPVSLSGVISFVP